VRESMRHCRGTVQVGNLAAIAASGRCAEKGLWRTRLSTQKAARRNLAASPKIIWRFTNNLANKYVANVTNFNRVPALEVLFHRVRRALPFLVGEPVGHTRVVFTPELIQMFLAQARTRFDLVRSVSHHNSNAE
jgi:hypothetical protein